MVARLGNVLYWAACAIAPLLGVRAARAAARPRVGGGGSASVSISAL
jgi:hypothetical protein